MTPTTILLVSQNLQFSFTKEDSNVKAIYPDIVTFHSSLFVISLSFAYLHFQSCERLLEKKNGFYKCLGENFWAKIEMGPTCCLRWLWVRTCSPLWGD